MIRPVNNNLLMDVFTVSLVIKLSTELLLIASLYNSILFLY